MRLIALTLLSMLSGCGAPRHADTTPKEAWDWRNDPGQFGLTPARYDDLAKTPALSGFLPDKPWQDSYWPYTDTHMAFRYLTKAKFPSLGMQLASAETNPTDPTLSPAEKYDLIEGSGEFPATHESWGRYNYYHAQYGDDTSKWDWMGICHGWSPAALSTPATLHHVLAHNKKGTEVLFFEGDIRGLLSKVYADDRTSGGQQTVGSRCDLKSAQIVRDAHGRPVDGTFKDGGKPFFIVEDDWSRSGLIGIADGPGTAPTQWLLTKKPTASFDGESAVSVYDSKDKALADLQAGSIGANASSSTTVTLQKACRDVNPAGFHMALFHDYSDAGPAKHGFVLETARDYEIWNQPVYGFKSVVGPLQPLDQDSAATRPFRAPNATQTAKVHTWLAFIHEPGDNVAHESYDDERNQSLDWPHYDTTGNVYWVFEYDYTLEFDAQGTLVGGEWTEAPAGQTIANQPDFLWRTVGEPTDQLQGGGDAVVKASLVRKLLDCSLHKPDAKVTTTVGGQQQTVDAVRCEI